MYNYNPAAWFWIVGGDETQVYSSAKPGFVPATDAGYTAWLEEGGLPTRIASLDELRDVLMQQYPAGWAMSLDESKAAKNAEINAARAVANTGTFEHGGKTFSCDQLSRSDIDGVNGEVALTGALPQGFPGAWKAVDNTFLPIADVAAWTAFYRSMVAQGAANFAHAQQLKTQLAAATTTEEVAAIVW